MNPELQRNLWLEASPRRIAWAAASVVLIFLAAVLLARLNDKGDAAGAVAGAGGLIFFAAGYVWAVRNAGQSILVEIGQRTWDFQRLSAISPWSMTWGKLLGATSLAWGVGLVGLIVSTVLRSTPSGIPATLATSISLAVLLQALALWASLIGVRKARAEGRVANLRMVAGGFILMLVGLWILSHLLTLAGKAAGAAHGGDLGSLFRFGRHATLMWWGMTVPYDLLASLSSFVFAAWALVGAWRLMRLEMQMKNSPWVWVGFLVFLGVYVSGFIPSDFGPEQQRMYPLAPVFARAAATGCIAMVALYAAAFVEPADRVRLRGFIEAARGGRWARALEHTPLLVPATIFAVVVTAVIMAVAPHGQQFGEGVHDHKMLDALTGPTVLAGLLFILRDMGIVTFFRFGPRPRRGDFGAVLGLVLTNVMATILAASLPAIRGVFVPDPTMAWVSVASGLVQMVAIWVLTWRRIRAPEQMAG